MIYQNLKNTIPNPITEKQTADYQFFPGQQTKNPQQPTLAQVKEESLLHQLCPNIWKTSDPIHSTKEHIHTHEMLLRNQPQTNHTHKQGSHENPKHNPS